MDGLWALLFCLFLACPIFGFPPKSPPLTHLPFSTVWNAPTQRCSSRFGVDLDLSVFDIVHNQDEVFIGANITIFYANKLGRYPYYDPSNEPVNGGVPQNSSLRAHLREAADDLQTDIPDPEFSGLAIVDWEKWRPIWDRNWEAKQVYQLASEALVKAKHPHWTQDQIKTQAVKEFEAASRDFMEETLKLGLRERPGGLWGFYGFPCCYNYQYKKNETYTGECPPLEIQRNDKLAWLWNVSTALYPNIYLDLLLRGRDRDVMLYSRYRILEAMRVRERRIPPAVFPYARIVYTYSMEFISQEDLVHTIGESVALGAAGVVLWGDDSYSRTKDTCEALQHYLNHTLGRYMVNVTGAASLCSGVLCSGRGRCVRRDPGAGVYLHLHPSVWAITHRPPGPSTGLPSFSAHRRRGTQRDPGVPTEHFTCQCFPGWGGERCQKPV